MSEGVIHETSPLRPSQNSVTAAGAERAAHTICSHPLDLSGRKEIKGYAIDSADPDSPMDRDDAVGIRYKNDHVRGKLTTLDISADVATASPQTTKRTKGSDLAALDAFAFYNGESLYFPHGVSPMLPRRLQDRLSLENGKERAAITVSVTFDRHGHPVHTEFARTRIKAKCKSYREAARDILLYGDPIQQISVVATQLLERKSGVTNLPHYDEQTGTYTDAEGNIRHISRDEVSAFTTVQGSMIAANEATAELMSGSPFLFRNHSYSFRNSPNFYRPEEMDRYEAQRGRIIQNKAEYSQMCKGHFGLNAKRYSHVTSPMRRYADLVNQRMMGWAIDVVGAVTAAITSDPAWDSAACPTEQVSYIVWDHARELLNRSSALGKRRAHKALHNTLLAIVKPIAGLNPSQTARICAAAHDAISEIPLPYTVKHLAKIAASLNKTLSSNRAMRREMQINEANSWLDKVFPAPDEKMLKAWGADAFSRLLEAAARRGDNHNVFAREVALRLNEDTDMLVPNLYSILIIAERHKDSHWQELKRQAFQMLKDDPALAERVFAYMQKQHAPLPNYDETSEAQPDARTCILEATLLDRHRYPHPSALVVLSQADKDFSAPIIDTADTPEKARQGAILTFFRHYGDLYPHQQLYTPRLIELALERAKVQKGDRLALLEKICAPHVTVELHKHHVKEPIERLEVTLTAQNKKDGQKMVKTRAGNPKTDGLIVDKAAKDMLEDRRFLDMLSQYHNWAHADGHQPDETLPAIVWSDNALAGRFIDRRPPVTR